MNTLGKKCLFEFICWIATIVVVALIILPIINGDVDYDRFLGYNLIFGFGAFTLLRYLLAFELHPLSNSKIFKVLFIFSVPILFFPILEGIHDFLEFSDREGLESLMSHLHVSKQSSLSKYIRVR